MYYMKTITIWEGWTNSANSITVKIKQNKTTRGHGIKKILDKNPLPENQKTVPQVKRNIKIKPRNRTR